jgi:hypothetical protein
MVDNNEDHGRSRRPGAEDRGWLHMSCTQCRIIRRSGGAVCDLHHAQGDEERRFLG